MSDPDPNASAPVNPVPPDRDRATPASDAERAGSEPTVGTGSFVAIGCVVLLVAAVIVLGAVFFRP